MDGSSKKEWLQAVQKTSSSELGLWTWGGSIIDSAD